MGSFDPGSCHTICIIRSCLLLQLVSSTDITRFFRLCNNLIAVDQFRMFVNDHIFHMHIFADHYVCIYHTVADNRTFPDLTSTSND